MSQWQIHKGGVSDVETFDDGIWALPGDDGFTTEHVIAEVATRGADSFSYIGRSTQVHERAEVHIAPRVEEVAGEMAGSMAFLKYTELMALPEPPQDLSAAIIGHLDEQAPNTRQEARKAVLRDMGLNETAA